MPNILDGLQFFYEREKPAKEIDQSAGEEQKYNAFHFQGRTTVERQQESCLRKD